jgi:3-methylcrotonyl-CoA carboxylase alpha subunit/geranyl-CoA carboxylase alpha subunit
VQAGAIDFFADDLSFEPAARGGDAAHATELRAPFNGMVIAVKARPGAKVARGDILLVLESMKLEHSLSAPRDAVVKSIHVQAGQQAAASQVLVSFEAAPA